MQEVKLKRLNYTDRRHNAGRMSNVKGQQRNKCISDLSTESEFNLHCFHLNSKDIIV